MTEKEETNRHSASLVEPFPVFTPSLDALKRIEALGVSKVATTADTKQLEALYGILIEDQAMTRLRVHKGFPLYWLAAGLGKSDKKRALQFVFQAFVEDVLTHGHRASQGFAAGSLTDDFGISVETLVALKEFVMERAKATFYPSAIVADFFSSFKGDSHPSGPFVGVSEDSALDAITTQIKENIRNHLRPSFRGIPTDEAEVQNVVHALLRQIDAKTDREVRGIRLAGKDYAIDFALFHNKVGVETKLLRDKGRTGAVIDEIIADITPYLQVFKRIIFIVYDSSGAINDPAKFVGDIKQSREEVEIVIA